MTTYLVRWEMELDADSPLEAAQLARQVQLDASSIATVFEVRNKDARSLGDIFGVTDSFVEVDLLAP